MSIVIGNDSVILLKRSFNSQDRLGVQSATTTEIPKTGVSVQPMADTESVSDVDITVAMWKLYTPVDSDFQSLTAVDAISYNGTVYEDFGDPQTWTGPDGQPHHITIILRKARG